MRASIAANARWSRITDRKAAMEPAHRGLLQKFEREVDPTGLLSPAERARQAENARKAHYKRMALRSSQHRSRRSA